TVLGTAAVVEARAVQAAPWRRGDHRLRLAAVRGDPRHDRREVATLREDGGPLDDLAAGRVRTRQPRDYGANRLVIHTLHHRPLRCAARARWSALLEVGGVDLSEARPL